MKQTIFLFVDHVKKFHSYLTMEYNLDDIPYNVSGRLFPKNGKLIIEENNVSYQFHGRGCTLYWGENEILYNIDSTSKHQIMIGVYGIKRFTETSNQQIQNIDELGFENLTVKLEEMEDEGVLMKRRPNDLWSWHVNELWYEAYRNGKAFTGNNKNEIDWI